MKKIAVEEHANKEDLDNIAQRLRDMDEAGIDMQVMSYGGGPGAEGNAEADVVSMARSANDTLAEVVEEYAGRFAGYAALPVNYPEAAAREFERAVQQLGLKGTLIFAGHGGAYLDEQKYWPIFEAAEKLDMPVYLHPGRILPDMSEPYMTYPVLSMAMWGFAAATGLHAMRLICSGVFDKYPGLKIILGHMGESLPFWLPRLDGPWARSRGHTLLTNREVEEGVDVRPLAEKIKKAQSYYIKNNFFVTISGMFWQPVLQFVCSVLGADRVLFAIDSPFESSQVAAQFMESVSIPEDDKEKIGHSNVEKLLKL